MNIALPQIGRNSPQRAESSPFQARRPAPMHPAGWDLQLNATVPAARPFPAGRGLQSPGSRSRALSQICGAPRAGALAGPPPLAGRESAAARAVPPRAARPGLRASERARPRPLPARPESAAGRKPRRPCEDLRTAYPEALKRST